MTALTDHRDPRWTPAQLAHLQEFEAATPPPEVDLAARLLALADALDYDAGTPSGGTFAGGLANAAGKIREALRGERVDVNGCPERQHHGVDCPGDACRYAQDPT